MICLQNVSISNMISGLFLGLLVSMILGKASADCQSVVVQRCERVFSKKFRDYYASGGKDLKEAQCSGVQVSWKQHEVL